MKAGLDGCAVECLKSSDTSVIEWLIWLLNVFLVINMVSVDWESACIVPLYKGKSESISVLVLGL